MSIIVQNPDYNTADDIMENEKEIGVAHHSKPIYPMTGIKVEKGFYTVYELKRQMEKNPPVVILDSEFQRSGNVWKKQQKCELIESVLMGLPLPIFYFNEDEKGRLIVVDGRQRLTTLFEYLDNKFRLEKLEILSQFNKKIFRDLENVDKTKIENYQIQSHNIPHAANIKVKLDIFDRVNRGGTKLTAQEVLNAIYSGVATSFLKNLVKYESFRKCTDCAFVREKRMKDQYLLIRFISLQLFADGKIKEDNGETFKYKNDMSPLIEQTMKYLNKCEEERLAEIKAMVELSLDNACFYLPSNAFRIIGIDKDGKEKRNPVNMNIFETFLAVVSKLPHIPYDPITTALCSGQVSSAIEELHEKVWPKLDNIKKSSDFRENIANHRDSRLNVDFRLKLVKKCVKELLGDD